MTLMPMVPGLLLLLLEPCCHCLAHAAARVPALGRRYSASLRDHAASFGAVGRAAFLGGLFASVGGQFWPGERLLGAGWLQLLLMGGPAAGAAVGRARTAHQARSRRNSDSPGLSPS